MRGVDTNIFFCILPRIGEFAEEISKSVKLAFVSVLEIYSPDTSEEIVTKLMITQKHFKASTHSHFPHFRTILKCTSLLLRG